MKKKTAISLALAAAFCIAVGMLSGNVFVNGKLYAKNTQQLDLRGQAVTVKEYESFRRALPECQMQWDVPLSGGAVPEDTQVLQLASLTEGDLDAIAYLKDLHTVEAKACTDYALLEQLCARYPDLQVNYGVTIDGTFYPRDAVSVTLSQLTDQDLDSLQYLRELELVLAGQCEDETQLEKLKQTYPELTVVTTVTIAGTEYGAETTHLQAADITWEEASKLRYLPGLKMVHLVEPQMEAEQLLQLRSQLPGAKVTWEVTVNGVTLCSEETEAEFTWLEAGLEQLETELTYLPELKKVILDGCGVDNETMAAWREEKRGEYKVVWTIPCGEITVRTDDTYFMPRKYELKTGDEAIQNIKYCEDMICIDIGHSLSVTHCEWAAYMPNLQYLILAETGVSDLTPLSGLKNLIFLEIFLSQVNDYSPLLGCTALEDLNLCYTKGDLEILGEMTWLKRLWIGRAHFDVRNHAAELAEKLPNCEINTDVTFSTGQGWRQNKNYFDMRDILGMFYMK